MRPTEDTYKHKGLRKKLVQGIQSRGITDERVLDAYCKHCAIEMNCVDLARAVTFLANRGSIPWSGEKVLDQSSAKRLSALMLTCGTYDAAGDFAFRVGLPAKSGVGGGIVARHPTC